MSVSWTLARSRLANATKRLRADGSNPEVERELRTARSDYHAARLELAIVRVIEVCDLTAAQRRRLAALLLRGTRPGARTEGAGGAS